MIEIALVSAILITRYDVWFIGITAGALTLYIVYTVTVTEWRTGFRRTMNELDSRANTRAMDSLINYETVKYFNNEEWEARLAAVSRPTTYARVVTQAGVPGRDLLRGSGSPHRGTRRGLLRPRSPRHQIAAVGAAGHR